MYTSLGNLLKTVNPALGRHGLSVSFEIEQGEKIKVRCRMSHALGHSESVTLEAPPDTSGGNSKNAIQQIKSTITYLRAATFEAITGIAATDEANLDDDGNNSSSIDSVDDEQLKTLQKLPEDWQVWAWNMAKVDDLKTLRKTNLKKSCKPLKNQRPKRTVNPEKKDENYKGF